MASHLTKRLCIHADMVVQDPDFPAILLKYPSRSVAIKGLMDNLLFDHLRHALGLWGPICGVATGQSNSSVYVEFEVILFNCINPGIFCLWLVYFFFFFVGSLQFKMLSCYSSIYRISVFFFFSFWYFCLCKHVSICVACFVLISLDLCFLFVCMSLFPFP